MADSDSAVASAHGDLTVSVEQLQFMCLTKAFSKTVIAPLDRVKYLLQCQGELRRLGQLEHLYPSALQCAKQIYSFEGLRSFWRGNLIQIGGILPSALSQAFVAIPAQRVVFDMLPHHTAGTYTIASFASGLAGAFAGSIISYPLDFARFRLAVDAKPFPGWPYEFRHSLDLFSHPAIVESPHNAYRGLGVYLAGSILYRSVYMGAFQLALPYIPPDAAAEQSRAAMLLQIMAGFGIVTLATLWLHPLDTVRRRMMIAVTHEEGQYMSAMHCAKTIMQKEGIPGFFRGAGFTVFRGALTSGLAMVVGINF